MEQRRRLILGLCLPLASTERPVEQIAVVPQAVCFRPIEEKVWVVTFDETILPYIFREHFIVSLCKIYFLFPNVLAWNFRARRRFFKGNQCRVSMGNFRIRSVRPAL